MFLLKPASKAAISAAWAARIVRMRGNMQRRVDASRLARWIGMPISALRSPSPKASPTTFVDGGEGLDLDHGLRGLDAQDRGRDRRRGRAGGAGPAGPRPPSGPSGTSSPSTPTSARAMTSSRPYGVARWFGRAMTTRSPKNDTVPRAPRAPRRGPRPCGSAGRRPPCRRGRRRPGCPGSLAHFLASRTGVSMTLRMCGVAVGVHRRSSGVRQERLARARRRRRRGSGDDLVVASRRVNCVGVDARGTAGRRARCPRRGPDPCATPRRGGWSCAG